MRLCLRALTTEERSELERIAHSRTEAARLVERARLVLAVADRHSGPAVAAQFGCDADTVYRWVHRFYQQGPSGLEDRGRSGRPRLYSADQYAEVIATAITSPKEVGLPFACWTLDRLAAYLKEHKGMAMSRNRIDQILLAEGLRWRTQESWFSVKADPQFKAKRGQLNSFTSVPLRGRS